MNIIHRIHNIKTVLNYISYPIKSKRVLGDNYCVSWKSVRTVTVEE